MAHIKIKLGNVRRYNASFYDTQCAGCESSIEEGDPCGILMDDSPPRPMYCTECLNDFGIPPEIEVSKGN